MKNEKHCMIILYTFSVIFDSKYHFKNPSPVVNEHLGDARLRKPDTGLGDHTLDHHTDMDNTAT